MMLHIESSLLPHSTNNPISIDEFPAWKMGLLLTFEWDLVIQARNVFLMGYSFSEAVVPGT